ncbi:hypothetical protein M9H77_04387 [Catharanthus roseus]|uniref:Uncharacterized protein n=1 Tax=Catharanthus roseus TaxID=4058 RepID=A0ACC0CEE7_CATRO|nr:hypothetical protein M9H77_04387 [Catharanthus roseus]
MKTNLGQLMNDVDIAETSRTDVDIPDIGTLIHESSKLELVDIRWKNSIVDEDENNKDEEEMVRGSKKKRAHPETSSPPALAFVPPGTSTSPVATSTSPVTLTPFLQLPYSSLPPISTPSFLSSAMGTSSRPSISLTGKYQKLKVNAKCPHIENDSPCRLTSSLCSRLPMPSLPSDQEVAVPCHRFRRYLLLLPKSPASRERRGCGDTSASTGQVRWIHDLVHLSVQRAIRFGTHSVLSFSSDR